MLVLTRKLDESIIVSEEVEIKVIEIRETTVKLGIIAPRHIKIFRKEVFDEIKKSNILAAQTPADALSKVQSQLDIKNTSEAHSKR